MMVRRLYFTWRGYVAATCYLLARDYKEVIFGGVYLTTFNFASQLSMMLLSRCPDSLAVEVRSALSWSLWWLIVVPLVKVWEAFRDARQRYRSGRFAGDIITD